MTTLEIVIIAVAVVGALLVFGGQAVLRRRAAAGAGAFTAQVQRANTDLAAAHAEDNGWEPSRVEAALREAFALERPGAPIDELTLVQVVDPPGTDDDKAVFRVVSGAEEHELTLGRRGDEWRLERID